MAKSKRGIKARKKLKKRTIAVIRQREYNRFEREVKKQVQQVNRQLNSLERKHKMGTWSTGKLKTRINNKKLKLMYKGKRIRLKPKMTKTQLTGVQQATRQFLESATSTNKGIEKVKKDTIQSLKKTLNFRKKKRLSDADVEALYSMLENRNLRSLVDEVGASLMWSEIRYAEIHKTSEKRFIERIQLYIEQDMDDNLKEQAKHIFETYVIR